jgi:hypothetical protein
MPPSLRRRPLTPEEILVRDERRARFEKASPLVISIVATARDLGRPAAHEQTSLPGAVTQLTHLAEGILHTQNHWKRGGRVRGSDLERLDRHFGGAVKVAEWMVKVSEGAGSHRRQLDADLGCLEACRAMLLAWEILKGSWDADPTEMQVSAVLDRLMHAHIHSQSRLGQEVDLDYRFKLKKKLHVL